MALLSSVHPDKHDNRARARERWLASGGSGGTISLAPP
jgi:hypothetical protein